MKGLLHHLASIQSRHPFILLLAILLVTAVIGYGAMELQVESDFSEEQPRQLPAYQITDRIKNEFGGESSVILLLEIDEENERSNLTDLRNPEVIQFLSEFEERMIGESSVSTVSSIGSVISQQGIKTEEGIKEFIDENPQYDSFFNDDYSLTFLTLTTNIGSAYEDIVPFERKIDQTIDAIQQPGGVEYTVTGEPPFGRVIHEFIISDAINTMIIASVAIFFLLFLILGDFRKSVLVFTPLMFGLLWTGGALGHLGVKLSIATVGLGSIILGLGVEYGIFMLSRFYEERNRGRSTEEATREAVSEIGTAIMSSGSTTIAGFLALTFSISPLMQKLGISLAAGIFFSILAAVFVAPLLLVLNEWLDVRLLRRQLRTLEQKKRYHGVEE